MQKALFKRRTAAVLCAAGFAVVLLHTETAAEAVRQGLHLCGQSVLPALFPMMFLAQYFVRSGGAEEAGQLLECPTRTLLGLPGICGAVLLTALVGGFPAGAAGAEALVRQGRISRRQGERLMTIAFCSGPGFTVGLIGAQLYHNKMTGLLILTAQAFSCIIIGIAGHLLNGITKKRGQRTKEARGEHPFHASSVTLSRSGAFVEAVSSASSAVLAMCGFIVLFQVFNAMITVEGAWLHRLLFRYMGRDYPDVTLPLSCLTEVTGGSVLSVRWGLPFTAFVVGFGGLSVHFQNFAICETIAPRKGFYLAVRLVQGCICAALTEAGLRLPFFAQYCVPAAAAVSEGLSAQFSDVSGTFGALFLVMCLMSVLCLPDDLCNEGKMRQ
jgi:sporulation integral membrane protein YlbJ